MRSIWLKALRKVAGDSAVQRLANSRYLQPRRGFEIRVNGLNVWAAKSFKPFVLA